MPYGAALAGFCSIYIIMTCSLNNIYTKINSNNPAGLKPEKILPNQGNCALPTEYGSSHLILRICLYFVNLKLLTVILKLTSIS